VDEHARLDGVKEKLRRIESMYEKYMVIFVTPSLFLGVFIAHVSQDFADAINSAVSKFVDLYTYLAPLIIFLFLTPALSRIINAKEARRFWGRAMYYFAKRRLAACVFSILLSFLFFNLPLFSDNQVRVDSALLTTLQSFVWMITHSPYFLAIWASVIVGVVSYRFRRLSDALERCLAIIEGAGNYMLPLSPLFLLSVGAYLYSLPKSLNDSFEVDLPWLNTINIGWLKLDPNTSWGMVMTYVVGSLLIGVACSLWHIPLVLWTKYKAKDFSITNYYRGFWIKLYPLLWSTSSETLALPLELYSIKKYAPQVKDEVRRFVAVMGNNLDSNGTVICVFVLLALVTSILGSPVSLFELLLCVPIVFFIAYGIPGIPGELILFASPIAELLNIPQRILPVFLALYMGLQMGLPDSFRTAANVTDDFLNAILLNDDYIKAHA